MENNYSRFLESYLDSLEKNRSRIKESLLGIAGGVFLGVLGTKVLTSLISSIKQNATDFAARRLVQRLRNEADVQISSREVKSLLDRNKEKFEGLSAKDSAKLLENLFADEFPDEYHELRQFMEWEKPFENVEGPSDPEKLAAIKSKYNIGFDD